jgi:peptidoglycan/LPS O-acetylase OafA/YrhL
VALCVLQKPRPANVPRRVGIELGDISYALYLFHFFAVVAAEKAWWLLFGKNPSILFVAFAYLIAVITAYAIHHLFEVNVTRLLTPRSPSPQAHQRLLQATQRQTTPPAPKHAHLYGRD